MKKLLYPLAAFFIVCSCNQPDYSELAGRIDDVEKRVAALEELCERINGDFSALQTLVTAMQERDFITEVTPLMEGKTVIGYTIGFSKNPDVTIYHGADGDKGSTPQIGVREDADCNYYWTLDGEWLTDREGGKIKAGARDGQDGKEGVTPRLKIEEGYWHLSYDNGETWEQLGKATGEDGRPGQDASPVVTDIKVLEESVEFTLTDGTVISLAKSQPLSITFSPAGDISVLPNRTYRINYTLTGSNDETMVKAIGQAGLNAVVRVTDARSGYIDITTPHIVADSEVLVFVSDGEERTIMRSIIITEGRMIVATRYYPVESAGGIVSVPLSTNLDYRIEIAEECRSWITRNETRSAMREETLTFQIAPNESVESRIGSVNIISGEASGKANIETILIYQNSINKSVPLRLLPDKSRIEQGDNITFAVELEGYDVTAQARILNLNTGEYLPGNIYHADTGGTVQFVAEYDGLTSRKVTISSIRDFLKKVVAFNFYATWCGYSYSMDITTTRFRENYPDILDEITIHVSDNFSNINSEEFARHFRINSTPTTFIDIRTRIMGALGYTDFERKVLDAAAEYAPAGLAVTTYVRGNEIEVIVHATAAAEGEYYLGVVLIENGLTSPQSGSGTNEYIHNDVFRKNLSPIPGESLGFFGKNEQKSVTYRTDISAYKAENCEIVCYLYTQEGDVLRAVNSTRCHAGEYTGYGFVD